MSIRGKAFIAGVYEHPRREIPDRTLTEIQADVALGALADAGLSIGDVDGYFCDSSAGFGPLTMIEYLGLSCSYVDSTETGG
ncbi:MAG: thiolase domain-containing protein, partial [Actinobacteria bacterium]|nr:thiolase domain-containing protein [Actinomycetota bacterium]